MDLKKFVLKMVCVIISMTIKLGDFEIDNILVYEKSHKNISSYENSYKTLIEAKSLRIWSNLLMELLKFMMEVHIWYFILCFEKYDDLTI